MPSWVNLFAGVIAMLGSTSAAAQITYSVFPTVPPASTAPSLAQPTDHGPLVTLSVQDSTIAYVVGEMVHQAHLRLSYDGNSPLFEKRVIVHVEHAQIMDALTVVLKGTGLVAKMAPDGETVVVRSQTGSTLAEQSRLASGIIAGHVTDSASGAGLGGATVLVEGTKLSKVTSDSGHFTLKNVPVGEEVLSVKLFGYRPAERLVTVVDSVQTTVRIVIVPVPTVLSGVVTTATGLEERYKVGNDITVLNADSIQQIAPVTNLTQMLATRVPGLIVQNTTGIPGAPSRLRLRGVSSVYESSDPILVVDGVRVYADQSGSTAPSGLQTGGGSYIGTNNTQASGTAPFAGPSALDQIDPNSIETIEVMKGPSATALYGSDAANGVIIITTKHGRAGPTRWTLSLDAGRTTLPGSWPDNYYGFGSIGQSGDHESSLCSSLLYQAPCANDSTVGFQALNDPRYSPLGTGSSRDASLTISGGSGPLTYSVTGSAATQTGYLHLPAIEQTRFATFHGFPAPSWMVNPDVYATYGGTSNLTAQLGQSGGTLALSSSLFSSAQQQSSLQSDLAALQSLYVDTTQLASTPLFPDYYTRAQLATLRFTNALTLAGWAPWHWLPITATAGLDVLTTNNNSLTPRDYFLTDLDSLGQYSESNGSTVTPTLTVGTNLLSGRLVSTAVGFNVYSTAQTQYGATTTGLPIGVSVPSSFIYTDGTGPSYSTVHTATYGWYVEPTINLSSRFFASPGFRLDGGSASGSNAQLNLFPKLDLSWIAVSRPPSHPMFGALTLLRPRLAFGIAGVQPGPADKLRLFEVGEEVPLTADGSAATPIDILQLSTLGNTQLQPERSRELEGGVDAEFWNQRLSLTVTGYNKTRYDAILSVPVPPSELPGYDFTQTSIDKNVGTISNKGVEATLGARILDSRLASWSVNAIIAKDNNKVVSLLAGQPPIVNEQDGYETRVTPGYPLYGVWAKPVVSFADANHDGVIENNEVRVGDSAVYLGQPTPNYELTLSTTLSFFNSRVSVNTAADYQNGLTQVNEALNGTALTSFGPQTTLAQEAALQAVYSLQSAIGVIQTVNTLRWSTLSVSYLLPPSTVRYFRVHTMAVALQGSNLALRTNYRGKDPDVNTFSSGNETQDDGELPQPRVWSLRVSLGN